MNENLTLKNNHEIGKLLYYYLILITDFRFKYINQSSLWSNSISNELFLHLYDKETLEKRIKERLKELLTHDFNEKVSFTFSLKEIQYVKQHLIGKKVNFYLEKSNENCKVISIIDEANKHLDYSDVLPIVI